jgi:hypothetical protein
MGSQPKCNNLHVQAVFIDSRRDVALTPTSPAGDENTYLIGI